jgi:D-alanyl-D-alanine carboxypeptidase
VAAAASPIGGAAPPRHAHAAAAPGYTFATHRLSPGVRKRITGVSWHRGCPVARGRLRYLRIAYHGFDGRVHKGEMVANASAVKPLRSAFATLFRRGFPIRRMRLVDDYGGSDYRSIEADNTSAFNCRRATGQSRWSQHAYGLALDVNPIENPYVSNGRTSHPASRRYLDRKRHWRGMAFTGGALVTAFARVGWGWGGNWSNPTDYQHFSSNGR